MPGKCKFANWPLIYKVQFSVFAYDGLNGKFYSSSMLLPVDVVATSPHPGEKRMSGLKSNAKPFSTLH